MGAFIELKNLCAGYGKRRVIKGLDLEIYRGEVIAVIGPNGAGKSTLLKALSRQLPLMDGDAFIDGRSITSYSFREMARIMAVILTERKKSELMTCRDVVEMGRYPYTGRLGMISDEDNKKIDAAIEAVHAGRIAGRDFNKLSDGQKQRILLARAICQEPEIILLDEPTSFLDIKHKIELLSLLAAMAKERGITVIMALHEIDMALKVADRVITIAREGMVGSGTPDEIFTEDGIRNLYHIKSGYFDPLFGSLEMPKPEGKAKVFVIAGGGSGISVYRELQRHGIPFATGVLSEGDADYRIAKALAEKVISVRSFCCVDDAAVDEALEIMRGCERVIDTGNEPGEVNGNIKRLREAAAGMPNLSGELPAG